MPNGIESIAGLLPRPAAPTALKDFGEIQQNIEMMRENQARRAALEQAISENKRIQDETIKRQRALQNSISQSKGDPAKAIELYVGETGDVQGANEWQKSIDEHAEKLSKLDTDKLARIKSTNDRVVGLLEGIRTPEDLPKAYEIAAAEGLKLPQFQSIEEIGPYRDKLGMAGAITDRAIKEQSLATAKAAEARAAEDQKRQNELAPFQLEAAKNTAITGRPNEQGLTPSQKAQSDAQAAQLNAPTAIQKEYKQYFDEETAAGRKPKSFNEYQTIDANRKAGVQDDAPLSDQSLDLLAENFAITGQLPPMGSGVNASKNRREIFNRAAKNFPGINLADNKAAYAANQRSLANLQRTQDSIEAFEKTAFKNLDQFLSTAKGVIDSGSPLVNAPLREAMNKVTGSKDQTAFNVARQIATVEIARVLNNPSGAGVLSDSARKEIQDLIKPDATLKQIYEAARILKQDMNNRRESGKEQMSAIRSRIGVGKESPAEKPATHRFNPQTGQIEEIK